MKDLLLVFPTFWDVITDKHIAAIADALLQDAAHHGDLEVKLLEPVRQFLKHKQSTRHARAQTTKVDFFTVAREASSGDDGGISPKSQDLQKKRSQRLHARSLWQSGRALERYLNALSYPGRPLKMPLDCASPRQGRRCGGGFAFWDY
jgi:hypothetical protein